MKALLTQKQKEIYEFLRDVQRNGEPAPSISEISKHFGFRSSRSSRDHLKALERKGLIRRDANKARSIRILEVVDIETQSVAIPLLGSITAGHPEYAEHDREGFVHVDSRSLGFNPSSRCYALRVTGDSMTGRGIYEGDIVVVDGSKQPCEGDIVAALIDNETTLKTLVKRNSRNYLKPENPKYPDMTPINELVIQGVVRTVIRNVC
ncbi:MAG: transcriptional repressor LexA [Desulfurivibrionaceae bacterium]